MLISCFLLAISVSIDSFGIGMTYGFRNTKVSAIAKIILFCISLSITSLSISFGNIISHFLSPFFTKLIGSLLLIGMGLFILCESFSKKTNTSLPQKKKEISSKTYQLFIRSLGLTIQIIRDPISSDMDGSHSIDSKEVAYLGFALSIDSACIGIGSSMLGVASFFPLLASLFQLFFLLFGLWFGKKVAICSHIPENIGNRIAGILLILIGIVRFFFS